MPLLVVVEQSADLRNQLTRVLMAEGFDVSAARDCSGLPDLLRKGAPGLIIVGRVADDPFASLETIRQIKSWSGAPVVFLPASSSEAIAIAALQLPVDKYLTPPVEPADVIAAAPGLC